MLFFVLRQIIQPLPPPQELQDEYEALCQRTAQRQREMSDRMKAEMRHVLTGYKPPKDTDLARTFERIRKAHRRATMQVVRGSITQ